MIADYSYNNINYIPNKKDEIIVFHGTLFSANIFQATPANQQPW